MNPLAILPVLLLAACVAPAPTIQKLPSTEQDREPANSFSVDSARVNQPELNAFARATLAAIQTQSIRDRVEYCGFIVMESDGSLRATGPHRGNFDSCENDFSGLSDIVASYHTHGAFGYNYDNEVPSTVDMEGDLMMGVDGFISTPGGRFWWIDHETRLAQLVCGPNCLVADPGYQITDDWTIRQRYDLAGLRARAANF